MKLIQEKDLNDQLEYGKALLEREVHGILCDEVIKTILRLHFFLNRNFAKLIGFNFKNIKILYLRFNKHKARICHNTIQTRF